MMLSDPEKDDYVIFKGAKLNRQQTKRVAFTLVFGYIVAIVVALTVESFSPRLAKVLVLVATIFAFVIYRRWKLKSQHHGED
jgi:uncharacterized protein involved in response to NO